MFCAAYKFTTLPNIDNADARFIACWSAMTDYFKAEAGALGSRLHRSEDGTYYAYAQWPSEAVYNASRDIEPSQDFLKLRLEWSEICAPSEVLWQGDILVDLLKP